MELPIQIVPEFTVTFGRGFTFTVTCAVFEQPPLVPVTMYVVVELGFAVTVAPVVPLNPVAGDQV